MTWKALGSVLLLAWGAAAPAAAAVLELRSGERLEGQLVAATPRTIQFRTAEGVRMLPVEDVAALRFAPASASASAPAPAPAPAPAASPAAPAASAAPAAAPAPRGVQLAAGTRLRVRLGDTIDPRQATEGDRFSALLEMPLSAGEVTLAPARSTVYGVVTSASLTGPPGTRLQLELVELQIAGQPMAIVTGTQQRVEAPDAAAPANAAQPGDVRLVSGAVLEFRLLQPLELTVQPR